MPDQKRIVLGVTGGVAAYKAIDLASLLTEAGFLIDVVLTRAAAEFVDDASFTAVIGRKPVKTLFAPSDQNRTAPDNMEMPHIDLAKGASVVAVAPATANVIAKIAHGIADDALTTTILASKAPLVLAPAMNEAMWLNEATQNNVKALRRRGVRFIGPDLGMLACGDLGIGRMAEPEAIAKYLGDLTASSTELKGRRILVTAGGTREPFDAVRFLGNRSSGKMGYALAAACVERGAEVILVTAPTGLIPPGRVELIAIETAAEMAEVAFEVFDTVDAVIMAAAVSDYRFSDPSPRKIKKDTSDLSITLKPNVDILAELGKIKKEQILVGFAAESENVIDGGRKKLKTKNLDMIVANDISLRDRGFDADDNEAVIISAAGELPVALTSKRELAEIIVRQLAAEFLKITQG